MSAVQNAFCGLGRPADLIQIALPRLNKNDHIEDYIKQLRAGDYETNWARVERTYKMDAPTWNRFVQNLLEDQDWLAGKGGCCSWTLPDADYFDLKSDAERAEWKRGVFIVVIAVCAPSGQTIYIDPQGYNYARYVGFALTGIPMQKSREQIAREQAALERASAKPEPAEKAYSRAEAITAIRAGLKRRSGRTWSVRGDRGTAWSWISIGLTPADRNLPQEAQDALMKDLRALMGGIPCYSSCSPDSYAWYVRLANGETREDA
jgi:hypothetical protein